MSNASAARKKTIPTNRREEWCAIFSRGNRGRRMTLSLTDNEDDIATIAEDTPLVAIDYDPPHKGNHLVITFGPEANPSSHVIDAPVGMWEVQASDGLVISIEVEDTERTHTTIITFT